MIHMIHQSYPIVPSFQAVWGMILGHDPTLKGKVPRWRTFPDESQHNVAMWMWHIATPKCLASTLSQTIHPSIWKSSSQHNEEISVKPNAINHPSALGVYDSIVGYSHQVLGETHGIYPMGHHAHLVPASVFEEAWEQKNCFCLGRVILKRLRQHAATDRKKNVAWNGCKLMFNM